MPVTPLTIVQAGVETTPGTAVAATRIIDMEPGQATLDESAEPIIVRRAGSLASGHAAYPGPREVKISFKKLPWSYTDAPWWLNLFTTPQTTGTGAGADKTYTNIPSDTADDHKRVTLEIGARDTWPEEYRIAGCTGKKLTLTIDGTDFWRADIDLIGLVLTAQAKTAALSARSVTHVPSPGTVISVDSTTFGAGPLTGRVVSAEITIEDGAEARRTVDGNTLDVLAATKTVIVAPRKVGAKVIAEFSSAAEHTAFLAASIQKVRIKKTGAVLGSSNWSEQIDINGVWRSFARADSSGLVVAEMELAALYDATLAADFKAVTVNDQGTLV